MIICLYSISCYTFSSIFYDDAQTRYYWLWILPWDRLSTDTHQNPHLPSSRSSTLQSKPNLQEDSLLEQQNIHSPHLKTFWSRQAILWGPTISRICRNKIPSTFGLSVSSVYYPKLQKYQSWSYQLLCYIHPQQIQVQALGTWQW